MSYRREDTSGDAGRIADRLRRDLGDGTVFMDVDGVRLGVDFVKHLTAEVSSCDALLAVIGRDWISFRDETGARRLDNPHDFVRIEIRAALQRDIPVIPILMNGTKVPRFDQLPEDIAPLALRNGLDVRHSSFHSDLDRLVRELKPATPDESKPATPDKPPALASSPETLKPDRLIHRLANAVLWIVGSLLGFAGMIPPLTFVEDMQRKGETAWLYIVPCLSIALVLAAMLLWIRAAKRPPLALTVGILAMALSSSMLFSFVVNDPNVVQRFFQNLLWFHPVVTALLAVVFTFMQRARNASINRPRDGLDP